MATIHSTTTAEQLFDMPGLGRCELVRGEIVQMSPAGFEHGCVIAVIAEELSHFVRSRRLGRVTGAETGFILRRKPDTVRAPDVGFVRASRFTGGLPVAFFPGAPDLAVEVRSPGDTDAEVLAKVEDWLMAGCLAVWVIDPADETAMIYRLVEGAVAGRAVEALDGEEIVPGFRLAVADIFAAP